MNLETLIETHLVKLGAEFPMTAISWRAQHVTKQAPYKALALAYIDARDVMKRLDEICGVTGWQCRYTHANGKTICEIGIKCGHEWVWKADGAGDTDIEAEKGAISDAFKRSAVKWGIGRYLYDMEAVWVPCEVNENGKFKKFNEDPWSCINHKSIFKNASLRKQYCENVIKTIEGAESVDELNQAIELYRPKFDEMRQGNNEYDVQAVEEMHTRYKLRLGILKEIKASITQDASIRAGFSPLFNEIGAKQ